MLKHVIMFDLQNANFFRNAHNLKRTRSLHIDRSKSKTMMKQEKAMDERSLSSLSSNQKTKRQISFSKDSPSFNVDKIMKWLEELVDQDILESEHDQLGTHFRIKRTSMRRAIHDAMLFKTRQKIHTKLIDMFHLYDSDPAAQRFILFNAEKASRYDEVFAFWNEGVKNQRNDEYERGTFSFEQNLSLISDKASDVTLALSNGLKLKDLPKNITNITDIEVEVKKRLAVHYIWMGKFSDATALIEDVLKRSKFCNASNNRAVANTPRKSSFFSCFGVNKKKKKVHSTSNLKVSNEDDRSGIQSWGNVLQTVKALNQTDFGGIRYNNNNMQNPTKETSYDAAQNSANQALSKREEIVKKIEKMAWNY